MSASVFVIRPRPPVRALVIAAVAALAGALLLVASLAFEWHVVVQVLGVLLLLAGAALTVAAIIAMRRRVVTLTLDEEGYRVSGANQEHRGGWAAVTRVTQNEAGDHITIYEGTLRTHLVFPGRDERLIDDVVENVRRRLRAVHR